MSGTQRGQDGFYPRELFKKAGELGFIGLDFPEEIGGGGLGILENVLVVEEFCKADSGIGMSIHLGYIPSKFIKINGTPDQQKKYLTPLVQGDWISAVAFTESDHGSDLTRMEPPIEEKEDCFVLRGTKIFTTNAAQADFFVVLAQDDLKAPPGTGMTTIIIERDPATWRGGRLEINDIPHKMGLRMTSSGELVFHDLKLPKENILVTRKGRS
jgi:alkylation response protein AidB-like acyl-CoA dehydrogenase